MKIENYIKFNNFIVLVFENPSFNVNLYNNKIEIIETQTDEIKDAPKEETEKVPHYGTLQYIHGDITQGRVDVTVRQAGG